MSSGWGMLLERKYGFKKDGEYVVQGQASLVWMW